MPTSTAKRGMEKFWGTFNCCRESAKYIRSDGSIMLTSSVAIYKPSKNSSVTNATSAAVAVFAKAFVLEMAPTRVNVITPGVVGIGVWTEDEKRNYEQWAKDALPVQHLGTAAELAEAYFSITLNKYMTGSVTSVDGGLSLK